MLVPFERGLKTCTPMSATKTNFTRRRNFITNLVMLGTILLKVSRKGRGTSSRQPDWGSGNWLLQPPERPS